MYRSILNFKDTQVAIKQVKDYFQKELAEALNLMRVTAPLMVVPESGLNDCLNGTERPVQFDLLETGADVQIVQSLANAFKVRNGSIICRELLKGTVPAEVLRPDTPPEVRTEEYYKKRPCPELIGDAAELLEQMLQQERISKKD